MATLTDLNAKVQSRDNRDLTPTTAKVTRINFDKVDRTRNALRTLGMWLAATFGAVFIPGLHFILVPVLFITSFVLALEKLNEMQRNEGGSGECPSCHKEFRLQASKWNERFTEICDHCHADLELTL